MADPPAPDPADTAARIKAIRAELVAYQRQQRERKLARGLGKPRTRRETEIWLAGLAKRYPKRADDETAERESP